VNANAQQLAQISSINNGNSSLNGLPQSISTMTQNITNSLNSPGSVVNYPPQEVNQPNYLGNNWTLGNESINDLGSQNVVKVG
jgi:hypothetical protein